MSEIELLEQDLETLEALTAPDTENDEFPENETDLEETVEEPETDFEPQETPALESRPVTMSDFEETPKEKSVEEQLAEARALLASFNDLLKNGVPANHRRGKVTAGRTYTLLTKNLAMYGKVPQQQLDLADILSRKLTIGTPVSEEVLFGILEQHRDEYKSLRESKQDVTYLFRYYRALKPQGNHAGFFARNFLRMNG